MRQATQDFGPQIRRDKTRFQDNPRAPRATLRRAAPSVLIPSYLWMNPFLTLTPAQPPTKKPHRSKPRGCFSSQHWMLKKHYQPCPAMSTTKLRYIDFYRTFRNDDFNIRQAPGRTTFRASGQFHPSNHAARNARFWSTDKKG